jgi:hypothetical protein
MQKTMLHTGVWAGVISLSSLLGAHRISAAAVLHPLVYWAVLLLPAGIGMVFSVRRRRQESGGDLAKKEAVRTAFATFAIAQAPFWIGVYLLFNHIDPGLVDAQRTLLEAAGRDVSDLDLRMHAGRVFFSYAYMLLPGFLLAYMVGSFIRR